MFFAFTGRWYPGGILLSVLRQRDLLYVYKSLMLVAALPPLAVTALAMW